MARSSPITREQWAAMAGQVAERQLWAHRLAARLRERGVPDSDSIWLALQRTSASLQDLKMDCHYKSTSGTGQPDEG